MLGIWMFLFIGCSCSAEHVADHASVIIIGAGASGLQAAQTLVDNGIEDFIILEAADYIGGRVRDVEFGGIRVEMGAHWAQPVGGVVQEKVWEIGMETHQNNWYSLAVFNSTGHNVTEEAIPVFDEVSESILAAFSIVDELYELNDPDMPIRSGLRTVGWLPETDIEKLIEWASLDFENGEDSYYASLKVHSYIAGEYAKRVPEADRSTMITDERGYAYLFNATMPFLSDDELRAKIVLNQKVQTIDQSGEDVAVMCADGQIFRASRVLVTVSCGVLQNKLIEFIPELPGWKARTINRYEMASYCKIYIQFPSNFWGDNEINLHASSRKGYYPLFTNLEAEGLYPAGSNILLWDLTGDEARRVEGLTDEEVQAEILAVLRLIYGSNNVPEPINIMVSRWSKNPLTMGSYSIWAPAMEEECFEKMESRVGNVFFGGEYTSEDNGYVQGGLDSGRREGEKIAQCQQGGECPEWDAGQSCFCPAEEEDDDDPNAVNIYKAQPLLLLFTCFMYFISLLKLR
ncbi:uncharacterized protein [Antedon mediterranea]|uniref:uncharacterized protein n=1 Tax=Antedon mediterranea TaxID=105859 RepID=UPI003AF9D959